MVGRDEGAGGLPVQTTFIDARPAALIDGHLLEWGDLRPLLSEAAGGTVLQEVILDQALSAAVVEADVVVTRDDVEQERQLFYETLDPDPDVSSRLGAELRARQGLGPRRFALLLQRNAALRALVADQVVLSEESIQRTWEVLYGPRRRARLLVVPTLSDAQQALDRLHAGEFFGDVAVEVSTDASAARGGLLSPISAADPSYPTALREALFELSPGALSQPILLGNQYAILLMIDEQPAQDVAIDDVRPALERQARLAQERILMDQLARRLINGTTVTIIDESLKEGWDAQFRRGAPAAAR